MVFFSSFNLGKTMWLTPSNSKFACVVQVFFSNVLIFPIKLDMLHLQNTKNATSMHVFCAMFDRKGLDPFRVQKFGLFVISIKNWATFPENYNCWVVDLCFDDLDGLNTFKHCENSETWNLGPKNMKRLDHNSKNTDNLRMWSIFHLLIW